MAAGGAEQVGVEAGEEAVSRRTNLEARCAVCRLHAHTCICAETPKLETASKLVLLVHYREARKPTNSGQLAARALGGRVEIIGDRPAPVIDTSNAVVLYPGGAPLTPADRGVTVIVPDGNWRQAAKMPRRIPGLADVRRVSLGDDTRPTEYKLRHEHLEYGLATFEAIARAWGILEGRDVEDQLMRVFRLMVSRTLQVRGLTQL